MFGVGFGGLTPGRWARSLKPGPTKQNRERERDLYSLLEGHPHLLINRSCTKNTAHLEVFSTRRLGRHRPKCSTGTFASRAAAASCVELTVDRQGLSAVEASLHDKSASSSRSGCLLDRGVVTIHGPWMGLKQFRTAGVVVFPPLSVRYSELSLFCSHFETNSPFPGDPGFTKSEWMVQTSS